MKFKPYCIIVMGETHNIINEIKVVSESEPNTLDGKGLFIATFISVSTAKELTSFYKSMGRNFMLFELNNENSGFNIVKEHINEGLFGFLKHFNSVELESMTERLMGDIILTSDTKDINTFDKIQDAVIVVEEVHTDESINKLTPSEKDKLWNEIIDKNAKKGMENISEYDKKILEFLAK